MIGSRPPTDLGYENLSPAIRHSHKRPKGGELTGGQTTYNKVIRGVHSVAERGQRSAERETFAALQIVSLDPGRIDAITKTANVPLHLEHDRPPRRLHQVRACQPPCPERLIVSCLM
jgi:hypothetical protein